MITEDYVSFETAKLLKEKGFDEYTERCFVGEEWESPSPLTNSQLPDGRYSRPTIQMAMKWLREVYHLAIHVELIDFLEHGEVWFYGITDIKTVKRLNIKDEDFTEHSYEQACEAAIKYCLENLI